MKDEHGRKYRVRTEEVTLTRKEALAKKAEILNSYDETIAYLEDEIAEVLRSKKRFARKPAPKTGTKRTQVFEGDEGYDDLPDCFDGTFWRGELQWININNKP